MWSYLAGQVEKQSKAQRLCPREQYGSLSLEQLLARGVFLSPETAPASKTHLCWVLSPDIPRGILPSESLRCASVSVQEFAMMRARHNFLKEAEIFKMLQLQGKKKKKYSEIQKLIVYYVATVGGDVFQTI